jgi:hypothetical protein
MAELDAAVNDALMAYEDQPHKSVIETPGSNYQVRIDELEIQLRELDFDAPDFHERQAALLAERKALQDLPAVPATITFAEDGRTVGEVWASLDTTERRHFLKRMRIKVYAKQLH